MTRDELKQQILINLTNESPNDSEVRVQPDPFGGWRVSVVSDRFINLSPTERRDLTLFGIDDGQIQFTELLTKSESEWSGVRLKDAELTNLPMWPDALSRISDNGAQGEPTVASQLDSDIPRPICVTFYSVKGGVGRSTALAYASRILARRGKKVVCVDLDLEAPGLAALLGVEDQVEDRQGVLQVLLALDRGEKVDISKHLIKVDDADELYCVPAGRISAEYARLLQFVNPTAWYTEDRNPFKELVRGLKNDLPFLPDVILVDSRTGLSEISAPLLFDFADLAIITFFPHPQAERANREVVRALMASKNERLIEGQALTPEPRFIVSPVPSSRIAEVVSRYKVRAGRWISEWLSASLPNSPELAEALADAVHFIPYKEEIATSDESAKQISTWKDYEPVADWIERFLPTESETATDLALVDKTIVLDELRFSAGTAEHQDDFLATFVEVGSTRKALDLSIPLILGRKGVGKTAVFRSLLETSAYKAIPITAPAPLRGNRPWVLGVDGFAEASSILDRTKSSWRQFWQVLIVLALESALPDENKLGNFGGVQLANHSGTQLEVLELIEAMIQEPRASLLATARMEAVDSRTKGDVLLLFDGLDTGFGNSDTERIRRREALEGLFELITDRNDHAHLRFKVVLREDIWKALRFENKSHFYGRSVTLEWRDQTTYFKVVLKQAMRSLGFQQALLRIGPSFGDQAVAEWSEVQVLSAWDLLIGERMKGEKTAFTRNWVWNRLADANGDHSPRYLLQLFREVSNWEKLEQARTPYEKSILRPRALIATLPAVSEQALGAISEEFPELDSLLVSLRDVGRTPVASEELTGKGELSRLALEVGLLGVYEGTEERVERYKVPEIYRYALKMTRKGQA
ncbi:MAG TPA: P-loop NTPase [Edaphobacter sp.]|nr:P-loop NTPase [Edaphobacter sp.]